MTQLMTHRILMIWIGPVARRSSGETFEPKGRAARCRCFGAVHISAVIYNVIR